MEQCRKSNPSFYLLGDFHLDDPKQVCEHIQRNLQLVWVGVARQIYTSIDHGMYQILSFITINYLQKLNSRLIKFTLVIETQKQNDSSSLLAFYFH